MLKIPSLNSIYPSKLILFGEYTVLINGRALALPIQNYTSKWEKGQNFPHKSLVLHFDHVLSKHPSCQFNKDLWLEWLSLSGYLKSSIPVGYGLGSSGNLIAAIFNDFVEVLPSAIGDLNYLKSILGALETYFHESSSGVDPLVCYLSKDVVIEKESVTIVDQKLDTSKFFLFDSRQSRNTKTLIQKFKTEMQNHDFSDAMNRLVQLNDSAIENMYKSGPAFKQTIKEISLFQFQTMNDWIPVHIQKLWLKGLKNDSYYFKLCGAGGGGFFLIYSEDAGLDGLIPILH